MGFFVVHIFDIHGAVYFETARSTLVCKTIAALFGLFMQDIFSLFFMVIFMGQV